MNIFKADGSFRTGQAYYANDCVGGMRCMAVVLERHGRDVLFGIVQGEQMHVLVESTGFGGEYARMVTPNARWVISAQLPVSREDAEDAGIKPRRWLPW